MSKQNELFWKSAYKPEHSITSRYGSGYAKYGHYSGGGLAIQYIGDDGLLAVLTVNIPDADLEDGEFAIKNWSGNESVAQAAMATGLFIDTGKRIPTGFVEAQVWRFKEASNG